MVRVWNGLLTEHLGTTGSKDFILESVVTVLQRCFVIFPSEINEK